MSGLDIKCYRVNYSREWLNGKHDTKLFPVDGAIDAIHALCDALEKKDRLLAVAKDALEKIAKHHTDGNNKIGRPLERSYTLRTAQEALKQMEAEQ